MRNIRIIARLDVKTEHLVKGVHLDGVRKIDIPGERVPFIGWKEIAIHGKKGKFSFVHSYQALPGDKAHVLATYTLGGKPVTAAIKKDNVMGVQFHPEKSAEDGIMLIRDFLAL